MPTNLLCFEKELLSLLSLQIVGDFINCTLCFINWLPQWLEPIFLIIILKSRRKKMCSILEMTEHCINILHTHWQVLPIGCYGWWKKLTEDRNDYRNGSIWRGAIHQCTTMTDWTNQSYFTGICCTSQNQYSPVLGWGGLNKKSNVKRMSKIISYVWYDNCQKVKQLDYGWGL